jgi:hypothetical protein
MEKVIAVTMTENTSMHVNVQLFVFLSIDQVCKVTYETGKRVSVRRRLEFGREREY